MHISIEIKHSATGFYAVLLNTHQHQQHIISKTAVHQYASLALHEGYCLLDNYQGKQQSWQQKHYLSPQQQVMH